MLQKSKKSFLAMLLWLLSCCLQPVLAEDLHVIHVGNQNDAMAASLGYLVNTPYVLMQEYEKQSAQAVADLRVASQAVCFYRQGIYLWGRGLNIQTFWRLMKATKLPVAQRQQAVTVLDADDSISVVQQGPSTLTEDLHLLAQQNRDYQGRTQLKNAELSTLKDGLFILKLPEATPLRFDPLEWEMLIGLNTHMQVKGESQPWQVQMIGKPVGEELRRQTLIQQLRQPTTLLVQSGNLLPGLNPVKAGQLSFQRPLALKMAKSMQYSAIAVGLNELRGGLPQLLKERKQFHLPLLSANLRLQGQPIFPAYRLWHQGKYRIAFVGFTSPEDVARLKARDILPAELEVLPTSEALVQALASATQETQHRPDLVVVLTNARGQELRDIRGFGKDVHLIMAEESAPNKVATDSHVITDWASRVPLTLRNHRNAINDITVKLSPKELRVQNDIRPVIPELLPTPTFLSESMRQRQDIYADALDTLLPDMKDAILADKALLKLFGLSETVLRWVRYLRGSANMPPEQIASVISPRITREMMLNLMANIMLASDPQSEVAVLDKNHVMPIMPGNLPKLLVYEMLKTDASVESWSLTGKQIKDLVRLKDLILAGLNPECNRVWGIEIRDKEIYQTLILSDVSTRPEVKNLLKGASRNPHPLSAQTTNNTVYLQDLVLNHLQSLRNLPDYEQQLGALLKPQGEQLKPILSFEIKQLQFNLKQYDAVNNTAFDKVRVTRVNSPDSLGFSGSGELSARYDRQELSWKNSVVAKLDMSTFPNRPVVENQDDLVLSSEWRLHFLGLPVGDPQNPFVPYIEALYDTEFSPTVNKDGVSNPRQSELGGVLGLSVGANGSLKKLKTGLLLRKDFNRIQGNLEVGFVFDGSHEQPLSDMLKWQNDLNCKYVWPSPGDSTSDLALTVQWLSTLKVSLTQNLTLNLFADTFVFQGKVPATSQVGASFLLGVGLSYDRIWKPYYELPF